jgi:peptide/nickel transport system substrate-binding protein
MKTQRLVAATVLGLVLAALAITPGISTAQESTGSAKKTQFIWADTSEPSSLNPIKGYLGTDYTIWALEYNLPIEFATEDFGPDFEHSITTSVDTSDDGMTFTYHIRDGMKWSDGEPFTAEDVAWTLNWYKENGTSNYSLDLSLFDSAEATDPTTMVLTATEPTSVYSGDSVFLYEYILPEHIWSEFPNYDAAKKDDGVPAVGSGPWVVSEYKQGDSVTMVRNENWWGLDAGQPRPAVDEIIYKIFNDENQEAAALQNGEIDYAYFDSANVLNALQGKPNVAINGGQVPLFDELGFNTGSSIQDDPAGGFEPHGDEIHAVTDPAFRMALRYATDSSVIAEKVFGGYAIPADSPVQPDATTGNWDPPNGEGQFNLETAKQMLTDAGYTDTDGNDVVNDPETGEDVELRYYVQTGDQNTVNTAPFVKDWWTSIGVGVKVIAVSSAKLGNIINDGNYDVFHWGWYPNPDPNYILGIFTCEQRPPGGGKYGNGDAYYCNPEYDELYKQQLRDTTAEARAETVHSMQQILWDDMPYIMLTYDQLLAAYRTDRFTGYIKQPAATGDLLATWGYRSFASLRPVSGTSAETTAAGGISSGVWIAIVVGVVVIIAAVMLVRRRTSDEDRA